MPLTTYFRFVLLFCSISYPAWSHPALSQTTELEEKFEARRFVRAKFAGDPQPKPPEAELEVLSGVLHRHTAAFQPTHQLQIGDTLYRHGIFCAAPSKIIVRLPAPGRSFSAEIGIDSNSITAGSDASVQFSVSVEKKNLFRSEVLREAMETVAVDLSLDGATEFVLEVSDAGDGGSLDHANWALASVILEDGRVVRLGGAQSGAYSADLPFSFEVDGKQSAALLESWKVNRNSQQLDEKRTRWTITSTDPESGLEVRCVGIEYHDFPTVEWTLHFRNTGSQDSSILSNIQALDMRFERGRCKDALHLPRTGFIVHNNLGSRAYPDDFRPIEMNIQPNGTERIAGFGGRPMQKNMPYFNVEWTNLGVLVAVGWPGQWAADFTRDAGEGLTITAGQELTHFKLHPGEEVRSPLIALQFWSGDRIRSQNIWRRWMLAHNLPRPGGKLPAPQWSGSGHAIFHEMVNATEENQKMLIDRYFEEELRIDTWWMDAGWYPSRKGYEDMGNWFVDKKRFPNGLRPITDHARSKGIDKNILWFEPERVIPGTWLYENHPEWLLGDDGETKMLYLGNPEARQWLIDHISKLLEEQGINVYRHDHNFNPLDYWRKNDAEDRQGITEIGHATGFLAFYDGLMERSPGLLIDNCASGGQRNDLETMRRSVPLWRTDYVWAAIPTQGIHYGLASWLPYQGTGTRHVDPYVFRSNMTAAINSAWDMRDKDLDYDTLRRLTSEWRQVSNYFLGDFYPLTPFSTEESTWMAWQFDRPDLGEGMVQAFRRRSSHVFGCQFKLKGLERDANYEVTDLDRGEPRQVTGRDLMQKGLVITLQQRPESALITYKRMK